MKVLNLHPWRISPAKARAIQKSLSPRVLQQGRLKSVKYVAGADVSAKKGARLAYAGVVVMRFPELDVVEERGLALKLTFPYVPGLLAFREAPAILKIASRLKHEPDLFLIDGQGIAHPRGFGIASHVGLLLGKPSIGCAKSRLTGHSDEPGNERGSFSYLYEDGKRVIGAVVRTRTGIKPIYVSIGHRIDLPSAIEMVLACSPRFRIPDPVRRAHFFVNRMRKG